MKRLLALLRTWLRRASPAARALAITWQRHLGRPAWVALLLLVCAALLQWQLRPLQQRDALRLEARRAALAGAPAPRAFDA
ncbi:MAG: hypothetical protein JSR38_15100, partial [Proteobacteria bacterium]|nr:hypothetical protein [Pseudomonadota bacterium]